MLTLCAKPDGPECLLPQLSGVNDRCSTSLHSWLEMQGKRCISIHFALPQKHWSWLSSSCEN